jgi:superfamily II DNA helicase RecQ
MVFTTPEMLLDRLLDVVFSLDKEHCLARIVFDEAHAVSTWGRTFDPQYKDAAEKMAEFTAPKLLLNATVSYRIHEDLRATFGNNSWTVISQSVHRENLTIEVLDKCNGNKFYDELGDFIHDHNDESGII